MEEIAVLLTLGIWLDLLLISARPGNDGVPLTDFITYYEPLYYNQDTLHAEHHRTKRSLDDTLHLDLQAHGQTFKIRLKRDLGVFHPELVIENSQGPIRYDTTRAYRGHLQDISGSHVHGVLTSNGLFEGKITTPYDQYVIEEAQRYLPRPLPFHSVIYKYSDINVGLLNKSLCHSDSLHSKLRTLQKEDAKQSSEKYKQQTTNQQHAFNFQSRGANKTPGLELSDADINQWSARHRYHHRQKRAIDPSKTTCTLYLQADHLFYKKYSENEELVIEQLTQHVQGVNSIYEVIDFDGDQANDNINFIIKRIKVHTDQAADGYKFPGNYGVETFLELFSEDNFDAFCLAYMFTYRDFEGGTLGLAWTGDLQNAGGVCEKNGQFRGTLKSLNSGIVTVLNYGKDVPSAVSHVTMAHEIGHNMGSQHDPEDASCSPGGDDGNYIMFARATSGDKPNNNKFSQCSQTTMASVMEAKARGSNGCFTSVVTSICGNEVVEDDEECDCGWDEECEDACCNPQTSNVADQVGTPCTRISTAVCSPSEGPCCSSSCTLITSDSNHTCRDATSCKSEAYCDGTSSSCPASTNIADNIACSDEFVCLDGDCAGSICLAYDLESCQCLPALEGDFYDENLCRLCCKEPGEDKICRSSFTWDVMANVMTKAGGPCYDYKGYCDVFHKCREVDPQGPLANLSQLFFSAEGIANMKQWLAKYWYIVLCAVIGFIVLMVVFIKLCTPKNVRDEAAKKAEANKGKVGPVQKGPRKWVKKNGAPGGGYSRGQPPPPYPVSAGARGKGSGWV